jgi:hypothetical protein
MQALNALSTELRTIKRHQRNTSNPWNFADTIIQVQPNTATYLINQADFGTPLSVITYAPQLLTWIPRLIPIAQPQNLVYGYGQPINLAGFWDWQGYDGSFCTADRCAFYWRDNEAYIEFVPTPQQAAQYQIKYLQSANGINQLALTATPITNEDADIAEVRTAIALLPTTEWFAVDDKDGRAINAERRRDYGMTLANTERELRRQFEAAQLTPQGDRLTSRFNPTVG